MTKSELTKTALNEIREENERDFVRQVKDRIKKIAEKQKTIKALQKDISVYQKEIREAELTAIEDNILG